MTAWQLVAEVAIDGVIPVGTYPTRQACLRAWREERRRLEDGDYGPDVTGFVVRELAEEATERMGGPGHATPDEENVSYVRMSYFADEE